MNLENVLIEQKENLAIVTINRPTKLNALNKQTIEELHTAFKSLDENAAVKVIIITGSGEKAFVAGADISEFANFSVEEGTELARKGHEILFSFVQDLGTPVIAAVNGFALGGGLELAMAAHFRVASSNAKMGLPEVSLGVIPGYGGTQRLPQLVGKGKAMEMIMTAGMILADEANHLSLAEYPHQGGFVDAPVMIYEGLPEVKPPYGLYIAGLDDYKHDQSDGDLQSTACGIRPR